MSSTDAIMDLFERRGADMYANEEISQLEHALQTAHLAVCHELERVLRRQVRQ